MAAIKLTGDTSGEITIAAPAVAGTNTLTLPASTGNIITTGDSGTITQGMIGSGAVTQDKLASGVTSTGPAFGAYLSANQSVTSGVWTKVLCNTEEFDTNSNYDNATNYRFQPTVAGYYQVNGATNCEGSTTRSRVICSVWKNGVEYKRGGDQNYTNCQIASVSTIVYLNGSTDYVELYGLVVASTALFNGITIYNTWINGNLVRAA